ncbi:MAG TPA: hypothetical protein VGN34_23795 [Ktedonobacteraceae bacterium]|jgi:hypothetical protein
MLRQRSSEQIRVDAMKVALRKAISGCFSCVDSYLALAEEHGATAVELQQIRDSIYQETGRRVRRRKLVKMLATGGLVAAGGALALETTSLLSSHAALSVQWGTDSGSQTCCNMSQHFYIGRLGYGGQPLGDAYYFNLNAARAAGQDHTFGYWGIVGPNACPAGMSPSDWGKQQATNAWNAWNHGPNAQYVGGTTVFGDLEPGFGGWTSGNYTRNQQVLSGFLAHLYDITPKATWPGLYISSRYWSSLLGTRYRPATDFVLWICGCSTCGRDICSPCDFSCNTQRTVQNKLGSSVANTTLGGCKPVVWQYWISDCGCGDYNVMTQRTSSLTPALGSTRYHVTC